MAMNVGADISREPDVMIDINTTPLIDVMLVLLVMLIITLPIQLHAVNLNMPVGNPPPPVILPQIAKIDIDANGTIYWNGEVVPDHDKLEDWMRGRCAESAARGASASGQELQVWGRRERARRGAAPRLDQDRHRGQRAVHLGVTTPLGTTAEKQES